MNKPDRGRLLIVFAVLFGLLAISDLAKPIEASLGGGLRPGFVLFGHRLSGTANAVVGPLFGLYLLVYAVGIWRRRRWTLPMGAVYAVYVTTNLLLFTVRDPDPMHEGMLFGVVYFLVAIGVSWGAVWVLSRRRDVFT
jgi:asparagine N-glycosylation enzyme membrane subunit Stt3